MLKANAEARKSAEEAEAARCEAKARRMECDAALKERRRVEDEAKSLREKVDAGEAKFVAMKAVDQEEQGRTRRALEDLNAALMAARAATETAHGEQHRALVAARSEAESQREGFRRELEVMRRSVEAAEANRDRARQEAEFARIAIAKLEVQTREANETRLLDAQAQGQAAKIEQEARFAADAAADAALVLLSHKDRDLLQTTSEVDAKVNAAKRETEVVEKLKLDAEAKLEDAQARWRGVAMRERDLELRIDAALASAAANSASFALARGDLAAASEAKLVADEERDAARSKAEAVAAQFDNQERQSRENEDRFENVLKEERERREKAETRAALLFEQARDNKHRAGRDAMLAAFEAQKRHAEATLKKIMETSQCEKTELTALTEALKTELDGRLTELSTCRNNLEQAKAEAVNASKRRVDQKKEFDRLASEREVAHGVEKRRLVAAVDKAETETQNLQVDLDAMKDRVDALKAREATLEAKLKELGESEAAALDRVDEAKRHVEDLVAECHAAQSRRLAAEEALSAQNEAAKESLAEAAKALDQLREDSKAATRAAVAKVDDWKQKTTSAKDGHDAAVASGLAMKTLLREELRCHAETKKDAQATVQAAREAEQLAAMISRRGQLSARMSDAVLKAADAKARVAVARAKCGSVFASMRASVAALDADAAAEKARTSAAASRADAAAAIAEARLDRENSAEQARQAKDAQHAANDALRRASAALAREKEYASRLEHEGFDELLDLRREHAEMLKAVKTAETNAEAARKDAATARHKMRDAQTEAGTAVSSLTARLRAAERLVETERERRSQDEATLRTRAQEAEQDATRAVQAAKDANAALRTENEQQRNAAFAARNEVTELTRRLDEAVLARDAMKNQIENLRKANDEADARARHSAEQEMILRKELEHARESTSRGSGFSSLGQSSRQQRRRHQVDDEQRPTMDEVSESPTKEAAAREFAQMKRRLRGNTSDRQEEERKDDKDDEVRRHLELRAAAMAGGLLPTPREEDDDTERRLADYERTKKQTKLRNEAEDRARALETGIFETDLAQKALDTKRKTTETIAAAARYLEKRRLRDVEREENDRLRASSDLPLQERASSDLPLQERASSDLPLQDLAISSIVDDNGDDIPTTLPGGLVDDTPLGPLSVQTPPLPTSKRTTSREREHGRPRKTSSRDASPYVPDAKGKVLPKIDGATNNTSNTTNPRGRRRSRDLYAEQ